jgi:hypothetical protein
MGVNSMVIRQLSELEGAVVLGMFAVMIVLLYVYAFEFVRYRTLSNRPKRKFNVILTFWMGLIGFYALVRVSFILGLIMIGLSILAYKWDKIMMERLTR